MPTPMPVAEEASRTSPILIVLLVLVILGGGAFALWKYVLSNKSDTTKTDVGEPTQPVGTGGSAGSVVPPPPPPPPAIVGELRMVAAPPVDVTAAVGGTIATIVEDGATVAIGDRIAKLGGAEKWENKLRTATFQVNRKTKDVSEAKLRLEAAQKDGNQKEIGQRQVALEDNEESLAKYTEDKADAESELAKYTLSAPVAGAIKLATSKGKRVVANDVVAQIVTPAVPMVTFDLPSSRTLTVDQPVRLITGENNALACTVAEVEGQKATVKCPVDGAPPDGAKVTLQ
jgi:multidrug resistance efflux pump